MKVFLRISVFLVILATAMVVITVFEFKDNHLTYHKPYFNSQPVDNNSNTDTTATTANSSTGR